MRSGFPPAMQITAEKLRRRRLLLRCIAEPRGPPSPSPSPSFPLSSSSSFNAFPLLALPSELLLQVASHLPYPDLLALRLAHPTFYHSPLLATDRAVALKARPGLPLLARALTRDAGGVAMQPARAAPAVPADAAEPEAHGPALGPRVRGARRGPGDAAAAPAARGVRDGRRGVRGGAGRHVRREGGPRREDCWGDVRWRVLGGKEEKRTEVASALVDGGERRAALGSPFSVHEMIEHE